MRLGVVLLGLAAWGCAGGSDDDGGGPHGGSSGGTGGSGPVVPDEPAPGVTSECGSVRLTEYGATDLRYCGFDRTHAALPDFVRAGMTVAIAEPYNGSSYGGDPGEACGECWEVDTLVGTQVVMVHDLCPIEGNTLCAGGHFHFDVSLETAQVLGGGGWLGEAALRRVPCPVTGNIHARVSDRNQWGYLKIAFFNHRFPIRTVEYRDVGGEEWVPLERCLARWCTAETTTTFAEGGPGAVFRLTSASGETVTGTEALTYAMADESVLDTGAQFAEVALAGAACEFVPPGDVYDEGWGGIDGVRWEANAWGNASLSEITEDCANASASCFLISNLQGGDGVNVTYRNSFPTTTFSRLSLQLRARTGSGEVQVVPRSEAARCSAPTVVQVDTEWALIEIDVATSCPEYTELEGLAIRSPADTLDLVVDEIRYE